MGRPFSDNRPTINREMRAAKRRAYSKAKSALDQLEVALLEIRDSSSQMREAYFNDENVEGMKTCDRIIAWVEGAIIDPRQNKRSIRNMITMFNGLPEED